MSEQADEKVNEAVGDFSGLQLLGSQTRDLVARLSDCELSSYGKEMANAEIDVVDLTNKKSSIGALIKDKKERIERLSKAIAYGHEPRKVRCETRADFVNNEAVIVRMDTGAVVGRRGLEARERQQELDLGDGRREAVIETGPVVVQLHVMDAGPVDPAEYWIEGDVTTDDIGEAWRFDCAADALDAIGDEGAPEGMEWVILPAPAVAADVAESADDDGGFDAEAMEDAAPLGD